MIVSLPSLLIVFCYIQMTSKSFCAPINVVLFLLADLTRSSTITHFYISVHISRVKSVKHLGVWLNKTLSFNVHIEHVLKKANKSLGLIVRLSSEMRDPSCLKAMYCCWVRSTLDYAAVVWSPQALWRWPGWRVFSVSWRILGSSQQTLPTYPIRCHLLGLDPIPTSKTALLLVSSPTTLMFLSSCPLFRFMLHPVACVIDPRLYPTPPYSLRS